jgi:hypothetical protein
MGTIQIESGVHGAQVQVGEQVVGITPMPGPWTMAPGVHRVVVSAKGHKTFSARVRVAAGRLTVVPVFVKPPTKKVAPKVIHRTVYTGAGFSLAWAGYLSAGVGLAAVGTGVVFGLAADTHAEDARAVDRQDPNNTRAGLQQLIDDADQAAFTANLLYGVGAVAIVSGVAMALLAGDGPFGLTVAPTANGAAIGGRF